MRLSERWRAGKLLLMTVTALIAVAVVGSSNVLAQKPAPASPNTFTSAGCTDLLELTCPGGAPNTTAVIVEVTNCAGSIDAFGFEVTFDPDRFDYVGLDLVGSLVEDWVVADATLVDGTNDRVRFGGFDGSGFGPVNQSILATLLFRPKPLAVAPSLFAIDPSSTTDDVATFTLVDLDPSECTIVSDGSASWGMLKASY